jgi:hypothetical protein
VCVDLGEALCFSWFFGDDSKVSQVQKAADGFSDSLAAMVDCRGGQAVTLAQFCRVVVNFRQEAIKLLYPKEDDLGVEAIPTRLYDVRVA